MSKTNLAIVETHRNQKNFYKTVEQEYSLDITKSHQKYIDTINNNIMTIGIGPAGTGKTLFAARAALEQLKNKEISRIVLTRPAMEADEKLGSLPGEIKDKFAPYFEPFEDILYELEDAAYIKKLLDSEVIIAKPLAYLRGKSFHDAFVILDEAQNCTIKQMKLFLTRMGKASKGVITGDMKQIDLKNSQSGLIDAVNRLSDMPGFVGIHEFKKEDCKRCEFVRAVLDKYEEENG